MGRIRGTRWSQAAVAGDAPVGTVPRDQSICRNARASVSGMCLARFRSDHQPPPDRSSPSRTGLPKLYQLAAWPRVDVVLLDWFSAAIWRRRRESGSACRIRLGADRVLLPPERGRGCRPAGDNRPFFEGMTWMARTGSQWRQLPDEYGKWNSVFRYRSWIKGGVFDAMLETLAEMAGWDRIADMIDSTIVRAHHRAVGIEKGLGQPRRSVARAAASRPGSMSGATARAARPASCPTGRSARR